MISRDFGQVSPPIARRFSFAALACVLIAASSSAIAGTAHGTSLGLPSVAVPADNPHDPQKAALGEKLFFDKRLSANGQISCASCHQPNRDFADDRALAKGILGRVGTRNTPSLRNATFAREQLWDGRRDSLEAQVADPFVNALEHGLSHERLLSLLRSNATYSQRFREVFDVEGDDIAISHVRRALATYVRTLARGNSAFDQFQYAGKTGALSHAARRGYELFRGRAQCSSCHTIDEHGATLTDNRFHSLGVGLAAPGTSLAILATRVAMMPQAQLEQLVLQDRDVAALGRFIVTKDPKDIGRFRTPSLRDVAMTAPYMHDGAVATLEAAVDHEVYYRGLEAGRPLILTPAEKADLVAFLRALSGAP
jgi:cytochrome c peroxidase